MILHEPVFIRQILYVVSSHQIHDSTVSIKLFSSSRIILDLVIASDSRQVLLTDIDRLLIDGTLRQACSSPFRFFFDESFEMLNGYLSQLMIQTGVCAFLSLRNI